MKKNYCINIYEKGKDGNYDYIASWTLVDAIDDVWCCMGWLVNRLQYTLTIDYLLFYDIARDDMKTYITKALNNNGIILKANNSNIVFKIEER